MKTPSREKTAIRLKGLREQLDAIEAREDAGSTPAAPNRKVSLILWACVVAVGALIYYLAAWFQRH
jgi:hypothetical protein